MIRFFRKKKQVPDGLFVKCPGCEALVYRKTVTERFQVCPECNYHMTLGAWDRINLHLDPGSFEELDGNLLPADPLNFVAIKAYAEQMKSDREKTGLNEAIVCGVGRIEGREVVFASMDFRIRGGSMASVVGEKLSRAVEAALSRNLPLITIASSGGARMQESALSLMQMAKTCTVLKRFSDRGGLHISVMSHPTTGGVTASWASVGDVIIAEPGALIGFAGRRVISETIKQELPDDFQTAEFLLDHGFLDMIVDRSALKSTLARLVNYFCPPPPPLPESVLSTPEAG